LYRRGYPALDTYVCERFSPTVEKLARTEHDCVVVTASAYAIDLAPRVAAKLGAVCTVPQPR